MSKNFYGNTLSKEYVPKLSEKSQQDLNNIKKYFGRENNVHKIRNFLAFHYNPDKLDAVFPDTPDNFDLFLDQQGKTNNLYYFAEVLAGRALLKESGELSDEYVYRKLIEEILEVARWFSRAVDEIISCFIEKHQETIWDALQLR